METTLDLTSPYLWGFLGLVIVASFIFRGRTDIKCTWCGSQKLKFIEGTQGEFIWKYRNKGGSRDKRVKDNYQQAGYYSTFRCKKCGAQSRFTHVIHENPSVKRQVWKGVLEKNGEGERTATDFEVRNGTTFVDKRSAYRKSDD